MKQRKKPILVIFYELIKNDVYLYKSIKSKAITALSADKI